MIRFKNIKNYSASLFLRDVGIPLEKFIEILEKVESYIESEKQRNPLKRRGTKSKNGLQSADKLLLAFYYMRHYETFIKLGQQFGISESYANKIYHQMLNILIKVLKMPNPKKLLNPETGTVVIDVSEQPIERPEKHQKDYYSGKKKAIQ
jgi:hypothetical protein